MTTLCFQTERLDFQPMVLDDAEGMFILRQEECVMKWTSQKHPDPDIQATKAWIEKIEAAGELAVLFSVRERHISTSLSAPTPAETPISQEAGGLSKIIGSIGVRQIESEVSGEKRWEIGYMFVPGVWGRGYASEAVRGLLVQWFQGGIHARLGQEISGRGLYAVAEPSNLGSVRVLEKNGFVFIGEGVDSRLGVAIVEYKVEHM